MRHQPGQRRLGSRAQRGIGQPAKAAIVDVIQMRGRQGAVGQGRRQQMHPRFRGETRRQGRGAGAHRQDGKAAPAHALGGGAKGAGGHLRLGLDQRHCRAKRFQPPGQPVSAARGQGGQKHIGRGQHRQGKGPKTGAGVAQDQVITCAQAGGAFVQRARKGAPRLPAAQHLAPVADAQVGQSQTGGQISLCKAQNGGGQQVKAGPAGGADQAAEPQTLRAGQKIIDRQRHLAPVETPLVQTAQGLGGLAGEDRQHAVTCAVTAQNRGKAAGGIGLDQQDAPAGERRANGKGQASAAAARPPQRLRQRDQRRAGGLGAAGQPAGPLRGAGEMGAQAGDVSGAEPARAAFAARLTLRQIRMGGQNPAQMFGRHGQNPRGNLPDREQAGRARRRGTGRMGPPHQIVRAQGKHRRKHRQILCNQVFITLLRNITKKS